MCLSWPGTRANRRNAIVVASFLGVTSMRTFCLVMTATCLAFMSAARADQFSESFDGGSNVGTWTFGAAGESVLSDGGNPGAFLHVAQLETNLPLVRTSLGAPSIFTGDYRTAGVTSVGADLEIISGSVLFGAREGTLLLYSDNGTPNTVLDDWGFFTVGSFVSFPGFGWFVFDFDVPAQATSAPPGWDGIEFGPNSPPASWNALMTNVASVGFYLGVPTDFYLPQVWELGLDNPRITADNVVATASTTWGAVKALFGAVTTAP
jgi:hypothetical protein